MRAFRPPVKPSLLRVALGIFLPLLVVVPMGVLGALVFGVTRASYTITNGSLVVKSGDLFSGERTIRLVDITEARVVALSGGRRTAGTALPGLCTGRFSYPDLGAVWQVTHCGSPGVLVRASTEEKPIVFSPPDPEGFVALLGTGAETRVTLPPPDKSALTILVLILGTAGTITIVLVSAMLLFGPRKMRYLVGEGAFEVHTLFGRKRWPTAGARAKSYSPSRLWRLAGSAVPGYYTGLFQESGQSTRVYSTDAKRVVLFEGSARVLVSPEDHQAFLRALEEEGVTIELQDAG